MHLPAAAALTLALLGPAAPAGAAGATVLFRDGFESPPLGAGGTGGANSGCCGSAVEIPGWSIQVWIAGRFDPTGSGRFAFVNGELLAPAGGRALAFLQLGPVGGAQIARAAGPVVAGTTYTLSAAIGADAAEVPGGVNSGGWFLRLLAGAEAVAQADRHSSGAAAPAPGGWARNSLSWTATAAEAGRPLTAVLGVTDPGSGGYRVANFDNVELTAAAADAAVPAPASLGLLAGALLALAAAAGRRRAPARV